jgi:hypothetical protein
MLTIYSNRRMAHHHLPSLPLQLKLLCCCCCCCWWCVSGLLLLLLLHCRVNSGVIRKGDCPLGLSCVQRHARSHKRAAQCAAVAEQLAQAASSTAAAACMRAVHTDGGTVCFRPFSSCPKDLISQSLRQGCDTMLSYPCHQSTASLSSNTLHKSVKPRLPRWIPLGFGVSLHGRLLLSSCP